MWEVGKETTMSTWDRRKQWQSRTGMLQFSWSLCSWLLCSGALLGNVFSPGMPRNSRPHSCFIVLSLNTRMSYPVRVRKLIEPDLWFEIPFRNAIVWHFRAMTRRVLWWVIWFISTWLDSSEIYSYNSLSSH